MADEGQKEPSVPAPKILVQVASWIGGVGLVATAAFTAWPSIKAWIPLPSPKACAVSSPIKASLHPYSDSDKFPVARDKQMSAFGLFGPIESAEGEFATGERTLDVSLAGRACARVFAFTKDKNRIRLKIEGDKASAGAFCMTPVVRENMSLATVCNMNRTPLRLSAKIELMSGKGKFYLGEFAP